MHGYLLIPGAGWASPAELARVHCINIVNSAHAQPET